MGTRKVLRGLTCGIYAADDNEEIEGHILEARAANPEFWDVFDREHAYMIDGDKEPMPDGDYDEESSPVRMPQNFTENILPQKGTWKGFWCTVPANLLPERT